MTESTAGSKPLALEDLVLDEGSHGFEFHGQACVVEASNRIAAGEILAPREWLRCDRPLEPIPFADDHPSISRVIRAYVITLNDSWGDEQRQKLVPYAAKILCTATGEADEETRAWMATDWLVRTYTPAWLRLAGLEAEARSLEALARIADATLARAAQPTINAACDSAAAAGAAAWDAAWDAAGAAAWDAAGAAAWDAAGAAAWAAAWDAAGAAARAAARDAAWDAAGAAAWDAAGAAAWAALRPTVETLQASALGLLDEMCAVGR